ncbi:hypothetical protein ACM61V_02390 [Sphingomonas sp. TX0543]|uniref:hypothetical protein n=1 Tax=unclassified Sphingomonas TaxID=196159 RepID=UPI0010F836BE|nr:hypothetical protein [Sphingomonas sp. 3P27F8]
MVAEADKLLPLMEKKLGPDHRRTLQLLAVRAQSLGTLGRYAEVAKESERVWRTTAAHEGPAAFQAAAGRADTAETQRRAGLYDDGWQMLATRSPSRARRPVGKQHSPMAIRTTVADCLIYSGRAVEAHRP